MPKLSIPVNMPFEVESKNGQIPLIVSGRGLSKRAVESIVIQVIKEVSGGFRRKRGEWVEISDFTKNVTPMTGGQFLVSIRVPEPGKYKVKTSLD